MKNLVGKIVLMVASLAMACNLPPKEGKIYTFKEVGWTLVVPAQFRIVDSVGIKKMNEKGEALMEESSGTKLDISSTRTLITAKKGAGPSFFTATITPFDPKTDGDFATAMTTVKSMIYQTYIDQMSGATIDSSSAPATLGGMDFDGFHMTVTLKGKKVLTMFMLVKFYKGYEFGISGLYTDDKAKALIEGTLAGSKFQ